MTAKRAAGWTTLVIALWLGLAVSAAAQTASPRGDAARDDDDEELATVVVTSTRHPRLIGKEPLRVEAVPAEEIAENSTVRPGDVTSLLQELPGMRFDAGSAGFGATGLHLRGSPARHALVLRDGLPLPAGSTTSFGLLQLPPIGLQRVEVIKGVATPLYGASALAGVLNLVSDDGPGPSVVTLDAGSRGTTDLVAMLRPVDGSWPAISLTIADSRQSRQDIDGDRWAEIPAYERRSVRPRWTIRDEAGRSFAVTATLMDEERTGGTLDATSALGRAFPLTLRSRLRDAGVVAKLSADGEDETMVRASYHQESRVQRVDARTDDTTRREMWAEITRAGSYGGHDWVLGASLQHESLGFPARRDLETRRTRSGIFMVDSFDAPASWSWQVSARHESADGRALDSLRIAGLHKIDEAADIRISLGRGASPPSYDLADLADVGPGALKRSVASRPEVATSASLDVVWRMEDLEIVAGVFQHDIDQLLDLRPLPGGQVEIFNRPDRLRISGVETVARYVEGPWHVMASWTQLSTDAPLTPRYTGEFAALYEVAGAWRVGFEVALTGRQRLDSAGGTGAASTTTPMSTTPMSAAPSTYEVSVLAAKQWRGVMLFINGMNLNDSRQTRRGALLGGPSVLGLLPVGDAWGSLAGRTINIGVRVTI